MRHPWLFKRFLLKNYGLTDAKLAEMKAKTLHEILAIERALELKAKLEKNHE